MKQIVITQDQNAIDAAYHPYDRKAWLLNLFLEKMETLGYPFTTVEQITAVVQSGVEPYVRNKIVDGAKLEIGGVKISRESLIKVVEIPNISEAESVVRMLQEYHYIPTSKLSFNGRFSVPQSINDEIIRKHTVYAKDELQAELYADAKKVAAAINKFHRKYGPIVDARGSSDRGHHPFSTPDGYIDWNVKTWEYEASTRAIITHSDRVTRRHAASKEKEESVEDIVARLSLPVRSVKTPDKESGGKIKSSTTL